MTIGLAFGLLAAALSVAPPAAGDGPVVNIYSARQQALIEPLLEQFRQATGIEYNLVTGKADELLKRLELEGSATSADLFITVDAGRLHRAREAEVLQEIDDPTVIGAVPPHLRDRDGYWAGLSKRARIVAYAADRVDAGQLSTYEALTDPVWRGRICIRSSGNIYNQSLVASMIATNGIEATESWANGLVGNLARPPSGGDTDQIKAVAAGQCDLAIVNSYYYGRLAGSARPEDRAIAERLRVFWPNQADGEQGTHVNVSGIGLTRHAKNRQAAMELLRFLVSPSAQNWYASANFEYPVVPNTPISPTLAALGSFREDSQNLSLLGIYNREAVKLMDRAGWK